MEIKQCVQVVGMLWLTLTTLVAIISCVLAIERGEREGGREGRVDLMISALLFCLQNSRIDREKSKEGGETQMEGESGGGVGGEDREEIERERDRYVVIAQVVKHILWLSSKHDAVCKNSCEDMHRVCV